MKEWNTQKSISPEWVLFWTALGSPLIGAIPATLMFSRINQRKHIWWLWVTAVLWIVLDASVVMLISLVVPENEINPSVIIFIVVLWVWGLGTYVIQRSMIKRSPNLNRSVIALCLAIAIGCGTAAWCIIPMVHQYRQYIASKSVPTRAPVAQVGNKYDKNSNNLDVYGTNLQPGQQLYARLQTSTPLGIQNLTMMLEKRDGQGWETVNTSNLTVNPEDGIIVDPFQIDSPGTYSITFIDGNKDLASTTFTTGIVTTNRYDSASATTHSKRMVTSGSYFVVTNSNFVDNRNDSKKPLLFELTGTVDWIPRGETPGNVDEFEMTFSTLGQIQTVTIFSPNGNLQLGVGDKTKVVGTFDTTTNNDEILLNAVSVLPLS